MSEENERAWANSTENIIANLLANTELAFQLGLY